MLCIHVCVEGRRGRELEDVMICYICFEEKRALERSGENYIALEVQDC